MRHDTPHTIYNNDCNTNDSNTLLCQLYNKISIEQTVPYQHNIYIGYHVKYYEAIAVSAAFYHKCLNFSVSNYLDYFNISKHV